VSASAYLKFVNTKDIKKLEKNEMESKSAVRNQTQGELEIETAQGSKYLTNQIC
jgi:hypothetical protein